jgi:hypothetical protein
MTPVGTNEGSVIPGALLREPGIHIPYREHGFPACA